MDEGSTKDTTADTQPAPRSYSGEDEGRFRRGDTIDRFTVLDVVGVGGMGLVLSAYDATLDRKVAIKLLRWASATPERRTRLLREAQAMARLSHPNVVTVYEAGSVGDEIFVAMEYVDGETLAGWLLRTRRSWREVVGMFAAAGQGLAAAHRAGLVHRDFKPTNVLVGRDGAVRVADFGLVGGSSVSAPRDAPGARLTRPGALVGTPAYMSPEQQRGEPADARSDQYSFCVSLFEALYGVRPSSPELPSATASDVPAWVRDVLLRGLSVDPAGRWPRMEPLLLALGRDPAAVRRRWLARGAILAVLAASIAVAATRGSGGETCDGAPARLQGLWDDAARARVRAAFGATARPEADASFDRVDRALTARLDRWAGAYVDACRATRVSGEQSEAVLDLRMQCLERARRQLEAMTGLWTREKVDLERAVPAALATGDIDACSDVEALAAPVAPPRESRPAVEAVRQKLDEVAAQQQAGRIATALALSREAAIAARPVGYAPVLAEALRRNGALECDTGRIEIGAALLHQAVGAAAEARDDVQTAAALRELTGCLGTRAMRFAEATSLYTAAEAAVRRIGGDPIQLYATYASILHLQARDREAADRLERAIAVMERAGDTNQLELARLLNNLTIFYSDLARYDDAIAVGERALAIREKELGPEHSLVANTLTNLGVVAGRKGDHAIASSYDERVLAIREKMYPAESEPVALALHNLGMDRSSVGRLDEARGLLERAAAIREKLLGPAHPDLAATIGGLGDLAEARGELPAARAMFERAIRIKTRAYGEDHPSVAHSWTRLGDVFWDLRDRKGARAAYERALRTQGQGTTNPDVAALIGLAGLLIEEGRFAPAIQHLERARDIVEKLLGPESPRLCQPLSFLGLSYLETGRPGEAVAVLQRVIAITAPVPGDTAHTAQSRFYLARALWAIGERARAVASAELARDDVDESERSEVDRWLRRHRSR